MLNDYETEIHVLAGMIQKEQLLHEALSFLTDQHFTFPDTPKIFHAIKTWPAGMLPSLNGLYKILLGEVEVKTFTALKNSIVTENNFPYYLRQLNDMYIRRQYRQAAYEIKEICESGQPISEITELIEQKIMRVHAQEGTDKIITPEEGGQKALATFDQRANSKQKIHGIKLSRPTVQNGEQIIDGFPSVDEIMKGLKGGDLIILAAETGEGKTTLAQNIVRHASIHQSFKTFYQNTEMDPDEMIFRFVAQMSGIEFEQIYTGGHELDPVQRTRVRQQFDAFCNSNVYISQLPLLTPQRSRGLARQFKMRYGDLDLLVIDYVGRMEMESSKGKQEWQVMRDIAKECKKLAQELNTACILIAQLNEDGKLQGAKQMANEADSMFFLTLLDQSEQAEAPFRATHKLEPKKARRGPKRNIWVSFNKPHMYITEVRY